MFDRKEYMKKWRAEHKEEHKESNRKWREKNPDKIQEYNHRQYLRRKALKEAERG